jgi:hypothetical protein
MFSECGFELHPDGRVDFAFAVDTADDLLGLAEEHRWPRIAQFARDWPDVVALACFELDEQRWDREPSVFVPPGDAHGHEVNWLKEAWAPEWLEVVSSLRASTVDREMRALLVRCCAAIPARARLRQIGVMLGRATDALRICITNPAADDVTTLLETIGWSGDVKRFAPLLEVASAFESLLTVHLDVGRALSSRIGIELAPRVQNDDAQWPRHLAALAGVRLLDAAMRERIAQSPHPLAHIKVVFDDDTAETKAYVRRSG